MWEQNEKESKHKIITFWCTVVSLPSLSHVEHPEDYGWFEDGDNDGISTGGYLQMFRDLCRKDGPGEGQLVFPHVKCQVPLRTDIEIAATLSAA